MGREPVILLPYPKELTLKYDVVVFLTGTEMLHKVKLVPEKYEGEYIVSVFSCHYSSLLLYTEIL